MNFMICCLEGHFSVPLRADRYSDKLDRVPPALTWCPSAFQTFLVSTNAMDLCHSREPSRSPGMQHPHGAGDEKGKRSARSVPLAKASLQSSLVPQRSLANRIVSIRHPSTPVACPIRSIRE